MIQDTEIFYDWQPARDNTPIWQAVLTDNAQKSKQIYQQYKTVRRQRQTYARLMQEKNKDKDKDKIDDKIDEAQSPQEKGWDLADCGIFVSTGIVPFGRKPKAEEKLNWHECLNPES